MFTDLANPYGTAAFEKVAYPMPDLHNSKLVRKAKRSLAAPKPISHRVRDLLLNYNG